MSTVKILAVEDDPIYAETLEIVVQELGYDIVAIVDNASDALAFVKEDIPDLILMDIEINDSINGIELAARIKNQCSAPIIFVTSHIDKETFWKAKLTTPHAFITKPYEKHGLQAAIELALIHADGVKLVPPPLNITSESFYIKDSGTLFKVNPVDILYIESDEKYCTIHTKSKKHVLNIRLKEVLERLSDNDFIQTHRSYIVRKDAIEMINIADQTLTVAGKGIPIGKSFKTELFSTLNYL